MPHLQICLPTHAFPGEARATLLRRVTDAAADAERMPADTAMRALCWVTFHDLPDGAWGIGGSVIGPSLWPCFIEAQVPAGVLGEGDRERYVSMLHLALVSAVPENSGARLISSILLREVTDGTWAVNGTLWKLPEFARRAGYSHLQHLLPLAAPVPRVGS